MALAQKITENQQQAAATQQALRNSRRVIRRQPPNEEEAEPADSQEAIAPSRGAVIVVPPAPMVTEVPPASHTAITASPLDLPTDLFSAGLDRRKQNRHLLMAWLRTALVDGVDFGRIHIVSRDRCQYAKTGRMKECPDSNHWSKPSLFKPGAEKITGMLGMSVQFPSLAAYEKALLAGQEITQVMLRCELRDAHGRVVAEGVGARALNQDYGDINKSLKMAEKSAHIDATLRMAGLSEVFTQDLEDRPATVEEAAVMPAMGKAKAKTVAAASPTPPSPTPPSPPPVTDAPVSAAELASLRERIYDYGFTEKRVLAWLTKTTQGTVTQLEHLRTPQVASLLTKLHHWADAELAFAHTGD